MPILENRRYSLRLPNGHIHVVDVIKDSSGTSTKAYQIKNGPAAAQANPTVALTVQPNFALPPLANRLDAGASKFISHKQYQVGNWLSHGFVSALPAQTQFQHIFVASPAPTSAIVVPFALVFNPYVSTETSPSLIHEKPIDPELINSIFQVPTDEHKHNQQNAGGPSTTTRPPFYITKIPPHTTSSTPQSPASSVPNYFGTSRPPKRPNYLPPIESGIYNFDIRKLQLASTGTNLRVNSDSNRW